MKYIFTFFIAFVTMLNMAVSQNVGEVAPDFTLKDLSNNDYTLSENRGKVIMVFLIGFNCPLCIASAPSVQADVISSFSGNVNFQAVVIDVWNGNKSAVEGFKSSSNLDAIFLQNGSGIASSWSATYDRLVVIGSDGKMVFKGNKSAKSQIDNAKSAIQTALDNVVTAAPFLNRDAGFELTQNYPNPFANETKIGFRIGHAEEVSIQVFDITGKQVAQPVNDFYSVGEYEITLQRNKLKKGIYFYRFKAGEFEATKRLVVQ